MDKCSKCGSFNPSVRHDFRRFVCRDPWHNRVFAFKWRKWTFGFWSDPDNHTLLGIDLGPIELVWRTEGYRP